ncbi:MAG: hypothetical protein ABIS47_07350 [Acidimicrobiales bacterium]
MRFHKPVAAAFALTAVAGLAACGSNDSKAETGSGTVNTTPVAKIDALKGQSTSVTLDPSFLAGLTSLKLTPAPVGTATIEGAVATFPITGGNVTYFTPGSVSPYVQGKINHAGSGLSLTGGGIKVELTDFVVDPAGSVLTGKVTANGKVAAESAPLFFLDGRTLKPLQTGPADTAILEGTTVSLTKEAADLLNKTYSVTALSQYFKVGVAKITVNTK